MKTPKRKTTRDEKETAAKKRSRKKYNAKPSSKKARARRNKDRRQAIKDGRAKKGDGKDVHHPAGNARGRTKVVSRSANRRNNNGGRKRK